MSAQAVAGWSALSEAVEKAAVATAEGVQHLSTTISQNTPVASVSARDAKMGVTTTI